MAASFSACQKDTPKGIQKELVGKWQGSGYSELTNPSSWEAEFTFEKNGHYSAEVLNPYGEVTEVFMTGEDSIDHADKKFVIHYVDAFEHAYGQAQVVHPWQNSLMTVGFEDLYFTNHFNTLSFKISLYFQGVYTLTRVQWNSWLRHILGLILNYL